MHLTSGISAEEIDFSQIFRQIPLEKTGNVLTGESRFLVHLFYRERG